MSLEREIENSVKQVLETNTVGKAKQVLEARSGVKALSIISFLESALPLPIFTDPFLIAAILIDKKNTHRLILATTIFSVLGGVAAYLMAHFFFEALSSLASPAAMAEFNNLVSSSDSNAFVVTLIGAVTPVPYTITAWVVAVMQGSLLAFVTASIIGRSFRYVIVGYCVYHFGPLAVTYAKRYVGLASVLILILAGLFFWYKM